MADVSFAGATTELAALRETIEARDVELCPRTGNGQSRTAGGRCLLPTVIDHNWPLPVRYPPGGVSGRVLAPAYTLIARGLHWLTAAVVFVMFPLGIVIANEWGGAAQDALYDLHRSLGAVLIPVVVLRLAHRWVRRPAPLPRDIPLVQRLAARVTHGSLYALLLAQPFLGWAATSAYGAPVSLFGWFDLPPIYPENRAFSEQLFAIHAALGIAMAALILLHVAAALFHHFVRKDRLLTRMVSG